ncbi:MAG TPA: ribosome biogenesis GTP-binding protein YihA/YsxC [Longimicrobiales bacterium]
MVIKTVEFAGAIGAPGGKQPPGALPHVAFSGRSNVGKSSLINTLLGRTRSKVARVSATPGKTREVNFFRVRAGIDTGEDVEFFLVDLPGYGYARVPVRLRGAWQPLIEGYLGKSQELRGVVQLLDIRHGATAEDRKMLDYLAGLGAPTVFVLTKADKLTRSERMKQVGRIMKELGADPEQVLAVSTLSGEGREELLQALEQLIVDGGES